MPWIDREGRFKAHVNSFGIEKSASSASYGFKCTFALTYEWSQQEKAWHELNGLDTVNGAVWFIGKDGKRNDRGIDTLINSLAWDKNPDSLDGKTAWHPADCQVTVKSEEYKGKSYYKVAWINPFDGDGQPTAKKKLEASEMDAVRSILSDDVPF